MKKIALIPARAGSKRIPNKNIYMLKGQPLIAYSIRAAIDSGIFDTVMCATDSKEYADIAKQYGAEVPFLRPTSNSGDKSPDISWVTYVLNKLSEQGQNYDIFSILRPTSPFRKPKTIQEAYKLFIENPDCDSLRAIQKCTEHPGKMWVMSNDQILPLMPFSIEKDNLSVPMHSSQYANLPLVYTQNASLEIAWTKTVLSKNSIAGTNVLGYVSNEHEGYDINNEIDILLAEILIEKNPEILPKI